MSSSEPSTWASVRRLEPFVRPAIRAMAVAMIMALAASLVSLAVPQVLRALVDGPLASGDPAAVPGAVAAIAALGVLEATLYMARRLYITGPATGVEFRV